MQRDSFYLIGAGSHAKVVMTMLEVCGFVCKGIYDDNETVWGKEVWNVPVLGPVSELPDREDVMAVIGIGANKACREISARFQNVTWPVLVHPQSLVDSSIRLGNGTVVLAGSVIHADTKIGHHTIVNTTAVVDHDCVIGNYCHLSVGCVIADNCTIDDGVFVGMRSVVVPHLHIAPDVTIGPGSTILKDLEKDGIYFGTPARRVPKFLIPDQD